MVSIPHRKGTTTEISLFEYYCNTIVTTLQHFLPEKPVDLRHFFALQEARYPTIFRRFQVFSSIFPFLSKRSTDFLVIFSVLKPANAEFSFSPLALLPPANAYITTLCGGRRTFFLFSFFIIFFLFQCKFSFD